MARPEKLILSFLLLLGLLPALLEVAGDSLPSGYLLRVFSSALMLTSLALSQNVLLGYTGYPAFGGIAFFGVGSYAAGVLSKSLGMPFYLSIPLGGIVSALIALAVAPVLMRLRSHYFAIATLALQLALAEMVANLEFTGGSYGINLPIYRGVMEDYVFYLLFLFLTAGLFFLNVYIDRSVFGYALKAIREDELAAETLGVNTLVFKSVSFTLMALTTGLAGGVYAYWITYIDPPSVFDPLLSVKTFVALLLGGVGSTVGPVLGAFFLELVSEVVWSRLLELHGVVLGALIVLVVLLLPRGIVGVRR
ncbi:branched-chain amino acid ABC transporter permease [Hydrogenivirga sp. 128-5-R1-1]|uniref:branched-chain amino acid ABC transporter permease n=1 Tax=Hydrogenivirga sp. 128-5-R1-1 TaxID=392423 RepID=UPI00015EF8F1|nr:branched-chain amino acid ABC transporter permease [Hydrogenivirga sp. 128-5-R1-1]EDP75123.1 inner-membrane translocator [Hydrogenivirga sp. 128-5-R1-1]